MRIYSMPDYYKCGLTVAFIDGWRTLRLVILDGNKQPTNRTWMYLNQHIPEEAELPANQVCISDKWMMGFDARMWLIKRGLARHVSKVIKDIDGEFYRVVELCPEIMELEEGEYL